MPPKARKLPGLTKTGPALIGQYYQQVKGVAPAVLDAAKRIAPQDLTAEKLEEYLDSARPVVNRQVYDLMREHIKITMQHGTEAEKDCYNAQIFTPTDPYNPAKISDTQVERLIQRLINQRPASFLYGNDTNLLRDGSSVERDAFTRLHDIKGEGGDKEPHFCLSNYISYDEMKLSAFLHASSKTYFNNNGATNNEGTVVNDDSIIKEGVIMGSVGARFERPLFMEWQDMMVTRPENHPEEMALLGGRAEEYATAQKAMWATFYGMPLRDGVPSHPTYEEAAKDVSGRFISILRGSSKGNITIYLDTEVYKKMLEVRLRAVLQEANDRGEESGKQAYVHMVGLGLGAWLMNDKQKDIMYDVIEGLLQKMDLPHVADVDLSWVGGIKSAALKANPQTIKGIILCNTGKNPAEKTSQKEGKLLVQDFAWDGNSFGGNELWMRGMYRASGDPVAAGAAPLAAIGFSALNPLFREKKAHVVQDSKTAARPKTPEAPDQELQRQMKERLVKLKGRLEGECLFDKSEPDRNKRAINVADPKNLEIYLYGINTHGNAYVSHFVPHSTVAGAKIEYLYEINRDGNAVIVKKELRPNAIGRLVEDKVENIGAREVLQVLQEHFDKQVFANDSQVLNNSIAQVRQAKLNERYLEKLKALKQEYKDNPTKFGTPEGKPVLVTLDDGYQYEVGFNKEGEGGFYVGKIMPIDPQGQIDPQNRNSEILILTADEGNVWLRHRKEKTPEAAMGGGGAARRGRVQKKYEEVDIADIKSHAINVDAVRGKFATTEIEGGAAFVPLAAAHNAATTTTTTTTTTTSTARSTADLSEAAADEEPKDLVKERFAPSRGGVIFLPNIERDVLTTSGKSLLSNHAVLTFEVNVTGVPDAIKVMSWGMLSQEAVPNELSVRRENPEDYSKRLNAQAHHILSLLETQKPDFFNLQQAQGLFLLDKDGEYFLRDGKRVISPTFASLAKAKGYGIAFTNSENNRENLLTLYNLEKYPSPPTEIEQNEGDLKVLTSFLSFRDSARKEIVIGNMDFTATGAYHDNQSGLTELCRSFDNPCVITGDAHGDPKLQDRFKKDLIAAVNPESTTCFRNMRFNSESIEDTTAKNHDLAIGNRFVSRVEIQPYDSLVVVRRGGAGSKVSIGIKPIEKFFVDQKAQARLPEGGAAARPAPVSPAGDLAGRETAMAASMSMDRRFASDSSGSAGGTDAPAKTATTEIDGQSFVFSEAHDRQSVRLMRVLEAPDSDDEGEDQPNSRVLQNVEVVTSELLSGAEESEALEGLILDRMEQRSRDAATPFSGFSLDVGDRKFNIRREEGGLSITTAESVAVKLNRDDELYYDVLSSIDLDRIAVPKRSIAGSRVGVSVLGMEGEVDALLSRPGSLNLGRGFAERRDASTAESDAAVPLRSRHGRTASRPADGAAVASSGAAEESLRDQRDRLSQEAQWLRERAERNLKIAANVIAAEGGGLQAEQFQRRSHAKINPRAYTAPEVLAIKAGSKGVVEKLDAVPIEAGDVSVSAAQYAALGISSKVTKVEQRGHKPLTQAAYEEEKKSAAKSGTRAMAFDEHAAFTNRDCTGVDFSGRRDDGGAVVFYAKKEKEMISYPLTKPNFINCSFDAKCKFPPGIDWIKNGNFSKCQIDLRALNPEDRDAQIVAFKHKFPEIKIPKKDNGSGVEVPDMEGILVIPQKRVLVKEERPSATPRPTTQFSRLKADAHFLDTSA